MEETDEQIKARITESVMRQFGVYLKGNSFFYGKAIIPKEMLIKGSFDTLKLNPGKDLDHVVSYMFDYFCT